MAIQCFPIEITKYRRLTNRCIDISNSIKPIVSIEIRCIIRTKSSPPCHIVYVYVLCGTENPNRRLSQKADDKRICSNSPFGNVLEILKIVAAESFAWHNNCICTRLIASTYASLGQLFINNITSMRRVLTIQCCCWSYGEVFYKNK